MKGADDDMVKPFNLSVLLLKIEACLKRNGAKQEQKVIQSGVLQCKGKSYETVSNWRNRIANGLILVKKTR